MFCEKSVSELTARVTRVSPPDFDGNEADVSFGMKLDYKIGSQKQSPPEIQYASKLRRDGGTWRMTTVSGR